MYYLAWEYSLEARLQAWSLIYAADLMLRADGSIYYGVRDGIGVVIPPAREPEPYDPWAVWEKNGARL